MGVNAGLWLVPAEEFGAGSSRPRIPRDGTWFDLDKAWSELREILCDLPTPLDEAIGGDLWPDGRLDDADGPGDGTWLGFVSPQKVSVLARALEELEPTELVNQIEARFPLATDSSSRDYYSGYFEELRKAYRAAAQAGAGLAVLLC